ncbi:MAG: hypothetical protein FJW35_17925, partial [Acidobacteria bacterium]|nr:hypothetical protein [Acidobacteriota bacterium]
MKRLLRIGLPVLALLVALCSCAIALYVRSSGFRERARAYAVSTLVRATGMDCAIGKLDFDLWAGTFHLSGLEMKPSPERPGLLELGVSDISGVFRIRSLWNRRVDLETLEISRPRITLRVGESPPSPGRSERFQRVIDGSLRFAAGRIRIREGLFTLHERSLPLELALDDFECNLRHRQDPLSFRVALSYRNGRIDWSGREFVYDMSADVVLRSAGLDIRSFEIRRPHSTLRGTGALQDWSNLSLSVQTAGTIGSEDFDLVSPAFREARGPMDVDFRLQWDSDGLALDGSFSAPRGGYRRANFRDVRGAFAIARKVLTLEGVQGRIGSGSFQLEGTVQLSAESDLPHDLAVRASAVPLTEAARAL